MKLIVYALNTSAESTFIDNLVALEQAIKDNNEKIRTYTPLVPIIGIGSSSNTGSSFVSRLHALDPTRAASNRFNTMDISASDSDWSGGDDGSDTDIAGERV